MAAALPTIPVETKGSSVLDIVKSGQGILDIFKGSSGTTSTSSTTKTDLTPEAVKALLDQILGGTQGLAAVSSGQKAAGLYNSTVQTLLTNDLLSRAAGEVAVKSAPTTTSGTTTAVKNPQMSIGNSLLGLGATVIGKKALAASGVDKKIDDIISGVFGKGKANPFDLEDASLGEAVANFSGGSGVDVASFIGGTGDMFSSAADIGSSIGSGLFGAVGDVGFSLGADAFESAGLFGSLGDASFDVAGEAVGGFADIGTGGIPVVGPLIRAFSGDTEGAIGSAIGGTIGSVGGPIGTVIGSTIGSAITSGSVICTECYSTGEMSKENYITNARYGNEHQIAREGYQIWGIPFVNLMKKYKIVRSLGKQMAISHARYVRGEKDIFGAVLNIIGYPICWILGKAKQWHKQISQLSTPTH